MIIACTLLDRVWITACIKNVTNHNVDRQTDRQRQRQREKKMNYIHKYMYIFVSLHKLQYTRRQSRVNMKPHPFPLLPPSPLSSLPPSLFPKTITQSNTEITRGHAQLKGTQIRHKTPITSLKEYYTSYHSDSLNRD